MGQDIIPVSQDNPALKPERDYLGEISQVMITCSTAVQLSDLRAAENAVRKARSIYDAAKKEGISGLEIIKIFALIIQVLSNYAAMSVYQIEARFKDAIERGKDIISQSKEALDTMQEISGDAEEDPEMIFIKRLLEYFNTLGPATIAYIKAEQISYTGRFDEYRAGLIYASELFKKIDELPDSDNPSVLQFYTSAANMAERLQNRARYFESVQLNKTSEYIVPQGKKVFIIHGHSDEAAISLQLLLEKEFKLQSVILKDIANSGDSVIEKFELHARDCGYAFAIITSDDQVTKDKKTYLQARPNVLFELGWFFGRYGRSRVCLLQQVGTQVPSDLGGIVSLEFDKKVQDVFLDIRKELKAVNLIE